MVVADPARATGDPRRAPPAAPAPVFAAAPPPLAPDHPCARCDARARTFCRTLDSAALQRFRNGGTRQCLAAAEPLFHQGDAANVVFNVVSGTLKISRLLADGRRQIIGFLSSGAFLGLAIEAEQPFSAEAVEPSEVCRFPRHRFEAFIGDHPEMKHVLLGLAAQELAIAREQMVLLGRKTSEERLASFLLMQMNREAGASDGALCVRLPMNRADIADYLGLTKETVSRLFTTFKTSGVIRLLSANALRILDAPRLAALDSGARAG
jgi:CRP/FNR family transcriptional regulator